LKNFKPYTSARDICFVSTRVHRETKRYESDLPAVQTKRPGTLGEWTWRFRIEWAPLGDNGPEYVYGITIKRLPTYYSVCLTQYYALPTRLGRGRYTATLRVEIGRERGNSATIIIIIIL